MQKMNTESYLNSVAKEKQKRSVFVIYGRDHKAYNALCDFLRAIGLEPLELNKLIHKIGKANPHNSEILDCAFREAQAVLVLLTPDDEVFLHSETHASSNGIKVMQSSKQTSPSALLKAGMALGRCPERTILLKLGDVRIPTSLAGMDMIVLDNNSECRNSLRQRLKDIGCFVDDVGSNWLHAGEFIIQAVPTGILDVRESLPFSEFFKLIGTAQKRVIIFQMWMTIDDDDTIAGYKDAFRNLSSNNNCTIQILLLKPNSKLAAQRSHDLKRHSNFVTGEIQRNITLFEEIAKECKVETMQIGLFEAIAPFQLYIVDDRAFVGFYTKYKRATGGLQLEVSGNGNPLENTPFGDFILKEFSKIWASAEQVHPPKNKE
jgi:predicted nucleotide-binding protein